MYQVLFYLIFLRSIISGYPKSWGYRTFITIRSHRDFHKTIQRKADPKIKSMILALKLKEGKPSNQSEIGQLLIYFISMSFKNSFRILC